jgi:hypothetical protein
MSSYVYLRLESLQRRFDEIDLLLTHALENIDNEELYSTLCRSAQILLVAHFEGAIKDLTKDVIDDFNRSEYTFKDSSEAIKVTFCQSFMKPNENDYYDSKIKTQLLNTFNDLPVKYEVDPFLFNKYKNNNKNPNSYIVENILARFGVNNFLSRIENSDLKVVFQESKSDMVIVRDRLKEHLEVTVESYPYKVNFELFNISSAKTKKSNTFWHAFLDTIVNNRHEIAHGNTLESLDLHVDLDKSKLKVEILICAFILVLCDCILPVEKIEKQKSTKARKKKR